MMLRALGVIAALTLLWRPAAAHDIYTGVYGKNGQLCCGGNDCAATTYREEGDRYFCLTREKKWVRIPSDRITFLPIPGDKSDPDTHLAHLCYRLASDVDYTAQGSNVFDGIVLYCAFIPPGAI